jgi:hypothetical protein
MRKARLLLVAGVALGCLVVIGAHSNFVAQAQPQVPKEDASSQPPPDIKVGVRVIFGSHADSRSRWKYTDNDRSPLVVQVKGNWVQLKGIEPSGVGLDGIPCWVNFASVDWYVVVPK